MTHHTRLLIVDDNHADCDLILRLVVPALKTTFPWLKEEVHHTIPSAMGALGTNDIALVLCDDMIPGDLPADIITKDHPGMGLYLWLKYTQQRNYPFLLISGLGTLREIAETEGITFAIKDSNMEEIKEKATQLIERQMNRRRVDAVKEDIVEIRADILCVKGDICEIKTGMGAINVSLTEVSAQLKTMCEKKAWYVSLGSFLGAVGKSLLPGVKK